MKVVFGKNYVQRIMIVEDDELIRKELSRFLTYEGYEAVCIEKFENDFQTAESILQETPDLVLLDVSLPGCDGLFICDELRSRSDVPIIFVTGNNTSLDELNCMMRGGDDFIAKPYQLPVLLAHIRAVLRRSGKEKQSSTVQHYKGVTLDLASGMIEKGDKKQILTRNELVILYELFQDQGKIVSRTKLIDRLWDNEIFIDDNTLSVNITRIRAKLDEIGAEDFIETRRGLGYMI